MEVLIQLANKPSVKEMLENKKYCSNSSREEKNNSFSLYKDHKNTKNPFLNKTKESTCLCSEINNTDNIIFNDNICKLCGESKLETKHNIEKVLDSSLANFNDYVNASNLSDIPAMKKTSSENNGNQSYHQKNLSSGKLKNEIDFKEKIAEDINDNNKFMKNTSYGFGHSNKQVQGSKY